LKTSSAVSDPTEDEPDERDSVGPLPAWLLGEGELAHEVRSTPLNTSVAGTIRSLLIIDKTPGGGHSSGLADHTNQHFRTLRIRPRSLTTLAS
jgi:hypothetical protein